MRTLRLRESEVQSISRHGVSTVLRPLSANARGYTPRNVNRARLSFFYLAVFGIVALRVIYTGYACLSERYAA